MPVPVHDGRLVAECWSATAYAEGAPVHDDDTAAELWWCAECSLIDLACPDKLDPTRWRPVLARAMALRLLAFDEPSRADADIANELARYTDLLAVVVDRSGAP